MIQKDIVRTTASETTKSVIDDLGDDMFAVLIDKLETFLLRSKWLFVYVM